MSDDLARPGLKLLKRLASRGRHLLQDESGFRFEGDDNRVRRPDAAETAILARLCAEGLIACDGDGRFAMTKLGRRFLVRQLSGADGFALQHQDRSRIILSDPEQGAISVTVNHNESPLAWLRRRKGLDGRPMVGADEYAAGERLRADFERGQLRPRVTANWTATVASRRRHGGAGAVELTEAAMAARQRVENALRAVDKELAGPLVDLCCFLKGLEEIERERQWPARSGKVVIRFGLAGLARHYGLSRAAEGPEWSRRLLHWGSDDYRPKLGG
jgi:hypothetical protein